MPLTDIVLDTNVLVHATTGDAKFQGMSIKLLEYLNGSTELICVDEGFSIEDDNSSLIGSEYFKHLKNGMIGYSFVVSILQSRRIKECPAGIPAHVSQKVNQCISHEKPRDKTFIRIAFNSIDKVLVSHDYEDFDSKKRKYIKREFGVCIVDADEVR